MKLNFRIIIMKLDLFIKKVIHATESYHILFSTTQHKIQS